MTKTNRRGFLRNALGVMATTPALAAEPGVLRMQAVTSGVRSSGRYDDSMIFERKRFTWPAGKTLALWVIPNVEVWSFDSAADAALSPNGAIGSPDVINYATREYGMRVGLWRIADTLDTAGIKATVALNSAVCEIYPKAVDEMKKRGWEFMGHGINNSQTLRGLSIDQERNVIRITMQTIEHATGTKVRGWLSPGQLETANTLDLLSEAGIAYTGDWNNDDQPYRMKVKTGELYSLPYCLAINDVDILSKLALTGEQYYQALIDQFDVLYTDSQKQARVMGIPVHGFLAGQPTNIKYLKQAIQYMRARDRVWLATGSEIVDAFRKAQS